MQNLKVFGVCLSFEDIRGFPEEHTQMNSPKFFRIFSQRPSFLHYELIHCNRDTERRQNFPQSSSSVFSHYGLPGFSSVLPHQRPYRKHCTPSHCSFNNASLRANFIQRMCHYCPIHPLSYQCSTWHNIYHFYIHPVKLSHGKNVIIS